MDGVPSGMTHDGDGIAFFESYYANCSADHTRPWMLHLLPGLGHPTAFLSAALRHFIPFAKVLCCPSSALLDDESVEGLDRSSLTLGEACVVTCANGYTAAREPFRSGTDEHVTGGFCSFMPVGIG